MHTLTPFAILVWILAHLSLSQIARLEFYGVAVYPSANITRFEATVVVPPDSLDVYNGSNVQAIWPGVQSPGGLIQNVVASSPGPVNGSVYWANQPFYCCSPAYDIVPGVLMYPGDLVTSIYDQGINSSWLLDTWVVSPGSMGAAAGEVAYSGSSMVNDSTRDGNPADWYQWVLLIIEIQDAATWDFGPVEWRNILVVANTTSTDWCSVENWGGPMQWNNTQPVATVTGNSSSCYIGQVIFKEPLDSNATSGS